METYLETMATKVIDYNEHKNDSKKDSTLHHSQSAEPQSHPHGHGLKRRGTVPVELEKEVMEQQRHADQDVNIHWPTEQQNAEHHKRCSVRRSSSLTMDMTDSVLNFRNEDGRYATDCNHYDIDNCSHAKRSHH